MTSAEDKGAVCPTRLIPDQVATEDAFQHKAIALAIADVILHEDGGGAIALTGAWGSGKSTVVKFLKSELKDASPGTETFIFDAWAHQGDPLRRTFLEKLIRWCNDQKPRWTKDTKRWETRIDELAKRREETNSKISPNLTVAGTIGAISLLLVPAATQMYLKNTYAGHRSWDITGLALSVLPAAVAALVLLWWIITESWKQNGKKRSIPSFISAGTESNTTSETNKTADPTSVEFEKHYCDLLTEAMADNDRRLVIVVDNLDRIAHDDARSIWATLRVFFDQSLDRSTDWEKRVWVLVPFDPEAINDLWETSDEEEGTRSTMSRHFLEKTFQASFRVPPIILSNWENYLATQLRFAFPSAHHTDDEFHTIFRLYDQLKPTDNGPPTPRNLKLFVNKIGALHRQWQDTIPLTQQAAFALISDGKSDAILKILLQSDLPHFPPNTTQKLSGLLTPEWQRNLAAIFFNVPPAAATEALLSPRIHKALNEGDAEALAAQEFFPGFPAILERVIEDARFGMSLNPEQFAHVAIAFSGLKGASAEYDRCRNHIYRIAILVKQWQPLDHTVARGIASIAEITQPSQDLSPIIRSVRDSLTAQANTAAWCEALVIALPPLIARDEGAVQKHFRIQAPAGQFLAIIGQAQATERFGKLWKYMQPTASKDEVTGILAKQAEEGKWDDNASNTVRALAKISNAWDWESLVARLRARIQTTAQTLPDDVTAALDTLFHLSLSFQDVKSALQAAAQGDFLTQHFYFLVQSANQVAATAICVLALLSSDTELPPRPQQLQHNTPAWRAHQGKQALWNLVQNPNSNEVLLKELSRRCTSWLSIERWREIAQKKPDRAKLINQMLQGSLLITSRPSLTANELIANLDYWTGVVGQEALNKLLSQKAASGELAFALSEIPFSLKDQQLHLLALEKGEDGKYRAYLSSNLRQLSEKEWIEALKAETAVIDIALLLGENGLRFGQSLQDALDAHAKFKLSDNSVGRLAPKWREVIELLEGNDHEVFASRLLRHFTSGAGRIKVLLSYYGPLLSKVVQEDGPTRSIERIIQIIEAHDAAEVGWLASVVDGWSEEKFRALRADWRKRAEKCAEDESLPEDEKEALRKLISALSEGGRKVTTVD